MDPNDNGISSRKLWYAIGTSLLIFVTGVLAAFWSPFRSGLETVVGGELGALALYLGGNVSNKWVLAKNSVVAASQKVDQAVDDSSKPPIEPHPEESQ